ncbi:hypothetical protein [Myxococcus qinghaiensis]|uniref:hypothetical protein n=1 Tax=Myxococcus qinghaiensis TaxID=2906758 RepID=UPI0020A74250|nr:hypothetical protein [Myxococcus qinghaiensis]MCP3166398.1 hypothetical protein [Myxococcus qinghaiensis]
MARRYHPSRAQDGGIKDASILRATVPQGALVPGKHHVQYLQPIVAVRQQEVCDEVVLEARVVARRRTCS